MVSLVKELRKRALAPSDALHGVRPSGGNWKTAYALASSPNDNALTSKQRKRIRKKVNRLRGPSGQLDKKKIDELAITLAGLARG